VKVSAPGFKVGSVDDDPELPVDEDQNEATGPVDAADAADAADASDASDEEAWERPIDKFRRGAAGSVLAAGLLGLRDAMEGRPEKEEPAIVSEAPEPKLDHIDIVLDFEHPERSRATVYLPPRDEDSPTN
jgi:hypothetical protein